jgi:TonB-dependent receptor
LNKKIKPFISAQRTDKFHRQASAGIISIHHKKATTKMRVNVSNNSPKQLRLLPCILLMLTFFTVSQSTKAQTASSVNKLKDKVTLNGKNTDAASLLQVLQQQTPWTFTFDHASLKQIAVEKYPNGTTTLGEVLQYLGAHYNLQFSVAGNGNISVARGSAAPQAPKGIVSGKVIDEENGQPVTDATVRIGNRGVVTNIDGAFQVRLSKGNYEAEISSVGYGKKQVTDIEVKDNQTFELNLTLKREKGQLTAVLVKASASKETVASLYTRQKNNAAVSDGISQEQIRRTPDNNVAQVLKRVSGLTVQDGKFVTVRGMSERYNNVLMNGASLPSTEPNRRNFSFDIIPSNLIDNVVVNKTATPDLPGEFTGGMVQVNTIDVPRENFIQAGIGSGFNTSSTGKDFYSTKRYSSDYWGSKGSGRDWFGKTFNYDQYAKAETKYFLNNGDAASFATVRQMGGTIPNNYGLQKFTAQPMQIYQLSMGGRKQLKNESTIGILLAGSYRHEENIEDYSARLRQGPTIIDSAHDYNFITSIGAVGNLAWQTKDHKLVWRNLFNRRFSHETNHRKSADLGGTGYALMQRQYVSIVEQADLFHSRLEGEHNILLSGFKFDWFADMATVDKQQPDNRYSNSHIIGFDSATGKEVLQTAIQGHLIKEGGIFASQLEEKKQNIGGNFTYSFKTGNLNQKLKAGYWGTFRQSDYQQVSLVPNPGSTAGFDGYGKPDYQLFTAENIAAGYYYYKLVTSNGWTRSDDYHGKQRLHAGYLMADLNPMDKLRVIGGIRLEDNSMDLEAYTRNRETAQYSDTLLKYKEKDWLPSLNLIYSITSKINVRAAWYRTVARSDFRERAPYAYYDFIMRQTIQGVDGLKNSSISNGDVRIEWYPGAGEVVSVTGFYKKFKDPVELVSYRGDDGNYLLFYYNLDNAESKGIEFDVRKSLKFIHPSSGFLSNLYINANFTWLDSKVTYDPAQLSNAAQGLPIPPKNEETSRNRPLSGLSPYIINGGISYQGEFIGGNITYNRYGRRVLFAGLEEYDDTYENPRDVIDLQLSTFLFKKKMEIRINMADILHQDFIEYFNMKPTGGSERNDQDPKGMGYSKDTDWTLRRINRGSNYSMTISYRL